VAQARETNKATRGEGERSPAYISGSLSFQSTKHPTVGFRIFVSENGF
jgi:hypothetical protein